MAAKAQRLLWTVSAEFLEADYHFYACPGQRAACRTATREERPELPHGCRPAIIRDSSQWAANCPENFDSRAALSVPSSPVSNGRELDAERLYEQAIRSARVNGFVHIEALANELAGRFYSARGFETSANAYLREARHCYCAGEPTARCGSSISSIHTCGAEERVTDSRPAITEHMSVWSSKQSSRPDKLSSGEIVLERVVGQRCHAWRSNMPALTAGVLLLRAAPAWPMLAEATVDATGVRVHLRERPVSAERPGASRWSGHVTRAQETVILDDASTSNRFSAMSTSAERTHAPSCAFR